MPELNVAAIAKGFFILFAAINPIGSIPIFLLATNSGPGRLHSRYALRAVMVAGMALLVAMIGGSLLLEALGFRPHSVQLVGGILLFLFATSMIFGQTPFDFLSKKVDAKGWSGRHPPMVASSLASPAAILAIVMLSCSESAIRVGPALTMVILGGVLLIAFALLLTAGTIYRLIRPTGISVFSQVVGIVLAIIAVDLMLAT